jgi:hypothetical protein
MIAIHQIAFLSLKPHHLLPFLSYHRRHQTAYTHQTLSASQQLASDPNNTIEIVSDKMDSTINNTTASMPIPARNVTSNSNLNNSNNNNSSRVVVNDFSDVIFEFENSKSPMRLQSSNIFP